MARQSLGDFCTLLNPRLVFQDYHKLVLDRIEALERGEIRNLIICLPPRHTKTEIVSNNLPAWHLGRNPHAKVILASYNLELAMRNSRIARNKLEDPDWPFPEVALATDSRSAQRWGTTAGGEVLAAGVGAGITGFGADLLLIDDPFKGREDADRKQERDRVWNWFREDASTRGQPGFKTIVMATRWHADDLIGRLLNEDKEAGEWVVVSLPALAEDGDLLGRQYGEALDPDRYPVEELLKLKARIGERGWNALYQQRPTAAEGSIFHRSWFESTSYSYPDLKRQGLKPAFMVVDPAFGAGSSNDPSVIAIWGTLGGHFYLIDVWRKRVTYPELRAALGELHRRWRCPALIEDIGPGRILLQELRGAGNSREDAIALPSIPFKLPAVATATGGRMLGKQQRAEAVTNLIEGGLVHIPDDAPWREAFIDEHCDFPQGQHDDQVDTTVMALLRLSAVRQEVWAAFMEPTRLNTAAFGIFG